jgi:hypothetical protein
VFGVWLSTVRVSYIPVWLVGWFFYNVADSSQIRLRHSFWEPQTRTYTNVMKMRLIHYLTKKVVRHLLQSEE